MNNWFWRIIGFGIATAQFSFPFSSNQANTVEIYRNRLLWRYADFKKLHQHYRDQDHKLQWSNIPDNIISKAVPQLKRLVAGFPPRRSGPVGFVMDKVALGQVFSEYFGFPCQSSFHQTLHNHNHPGYISFES